MKTIISALFFASVAIAPAMALPLAATGGTTSDIVQVAGGCGAGWHRGPNGGCLKNFADPGAHACPRGYHIGPGGACRGNGR
ncbi:MAG: hypothetical protein HY242_14540 [Afipia sp.]|nr:hypothetical protein [Afipia sp.]